MTDLKMLADEMKEAAAQNRVSRQMLLEGYPFPDHLRRKVERWNQTYTVQFSYDELSDNKEMGHLSFSREDMRKPDDLEVLMMQEAFFGNAKVVQFPGVLGDHIIHMAEIRLK